MKADKVLCWSDKPPSTFVQQHSSIALMTFREPMLKKVCMKKTPCVFDLRLQNSSLANVIH